MTKVSCVITEDIGNIKHEYSPVELKFKDEGKKKPNTLEAKFTINNKVRENYNIAYIHDVVDVSYLDCIHNFQLSALDERGYDLDGEFNSSTNISEDRFTQVTEGRFKGNYALDFTVANQEIDVPNAKAITRLDISKQFDIYIFFTPVFPQIVDGDNEPILWSFHDDAGNDKRGLEIGITNNVDNNEWRGFIRIKNGSTTEVIRGTTQLINTGDPILIRAYRKQDEVIHLEVNGFSDGFLLRTGSLQPTDSDTTLRFGNNKDKPVATQPYKGQIHQVRSYHGIVLTQSQADTIRQARPSLYTMRFNGRVWNLEDKQTHKIAKCDSFSKALSKRKLDATQFPDDDNVFGLQEIEGESFQEILQAIVNTIDPSFIVKAKDPFASAGIVPTALQGNFKAVGNFIDAISILLLFSGTTFYTTPRKLLIVETNLGHDTDYIFDQDSDVSPYDITESGDNDTTRIGELILTARENDGTLISEELNNSAVGADFTFRKFIAQLNHVTDLGSLISILLDANRFVNTKYMVKINSFIHWVRVNHKVLLNNSKKNITNDPFIIAQMEYHYPSSITKINVNEIDIDFFNISNSDTSVQQSLVDDTT